MYGLRVSKISMLASSRRSSSVQLWALTPSARSRSMAARQATGRPSEPRSASASAELQYKRGMHFDGVRTSLGWLLGCVSLDSQSKAVDANQSGGRGLLFRVGPGAK